MATLYYWTRVPGHLAVLIQARTGELYVSHRPDFAEPNVPKLGKRDLPGYRLPVTVRRYPKLPHVTLAADLQHWGEPAGILPLSSVVDDDDMAEEARLFLNARATTDHRVRGYDSDYSYYQLAESTVAPTHTEDPSWEAQRRQCVTTTNRLLYYGISPFMQYLKDIVGDAPRRPRADNQPWTTKEVYLFCKQHLSEEP